MASLLRLVCLLILPLLLTLPGCGGERAEEPSVTFHTAAGSATLKVEVARSNQEKAAGLMGRESLAADAGMIFVYEEPVQGGFWMKNTLIPLSIAFVDQEGVIIDIRDMEPGSLESHVPPEPYIYAIEANQGYFRQNGISAGDRVEVRL